MSGYLLDERGTGAELGAHVVGAVFDANGQVAFALADGTLHCAAPAQADWRRIEVSDGALLDVCRDTEAGFLCTDDTGALTRIAGDGSISLLARWPGKWVEHVAVWGQGRDALIACSVGKHLHVFDAAGAALKSLLHPSTVTGIAFDSKGKRVAASHYNGASLWYAASKSDSPRVLEWKGSHIAVALHPAGDTVVTAMQENALHGWRLSDGQHMRMSGYPAKTESLSFSRTGKWLASSGADAIVLWPFFGGGPMGKAPLELAGGGEVLCTRVACHPQHDLCAAGYADGAVILADLNTQRILPVAPAINGAVSALVWSTNGAQLAFGTETGYAGVVDLAVRG